MTREHIVIQAGRGAGREYYCGLADYYPRAFILHAPREIVYGEEEEEEEAGAARASLLFAKRIAAAESAKSPPPNNWFFTRFCAMMATLRIRECAGCVWGSLRMTRLAERVCAGDGFVWCVLLLSAAR